MVVSLDRNYVDLVWAFLGCLSCLGKEGNTGRFSHGACVSMEIHEKSSMDGDANVNWLALPSCLYMMPLPWEPMLRRHRNTFLVGTVFTTCIIQIPLRLQAVNNLSTFDAGVRLLPYGVLVPFASFVAAAIIGKSKLPPQFVLVLGAAFQTIGISLMSKLPTSGDIRKAQYGYEVIAGMGTGLSLGTLVMLTPVVCEPRDLGMSQLHRICCRNH